MTDYFEASDGHDEPTLWAVIGNQHAVPVLRRSDASKFWPDIVARMTGTTITTDEATVETVAKAITPHYFTPAFGEHAREQAREAARNVLAALTGVPHEV